MMLTTISAVTRYAGLSKRSAACHDVVAGRVSWIGRPEGDPGPTKTVFDADLLDDGVWRSLTPHKLIRRSLIEDHQLRFRDDMVQGEDQIFMASCLFAARKISVLSETDLYPACSPTAATCRDNARLSPINA